jgi:SAM-dependent methyltransferase
MSISNIKNYLKKLGKIFLSPYLFTISIIYFYICKINKVIGLKFDAFGKKVSLLYLKKLKIKKFVRLFINPVSITRYFEFDFTYRNIDKNKKIKILDISSPRLFGMYINYYHKNIEYYMTNPDKDDLRESIEYFKLIDLDKTNFMNLDVLSLPLKSNYFDYIIMISVLEHIPEPNDIKSFKKLWQLLKPNGKLIITVPISKNYFEEFRKYNVYKLEDIKKSGKGYFFQRFYDYKKINENILKQISQKNVYQIEIFGEMESNFFKNYVIRWIKEGYFETVKDPIYILKKFKFFSSINDLVDTGVAGISLIKLDK